MHRHNTPHSYITPRRLAVLGTFLFLSLAPAYLFIRFVPFFFRPEIFLSAPSAVGSLIVYTEKIPLEGRVAFTSSLTLNGKEVYIRENGLFYEEAQLTEGVNTLVFEVKNRFGRKSEVVRRVVYIKN